MSQFQAKNPENSKEQHTLQKSSSQFRSKTSYNIIPNSYG